MGRSGYPKKEVISFPGSKNRISFCTALKSHDVAEQMGSLTFQWVYATLPHEKLNTTISLGIWMMDQVVEDRGRRRFRDTS